MLNQSTKSFPTIAKQAFVLPFLCAKAALPASLPSAVSALATEVLPALPCLFVSLWEALHPCIFQVAFECLLHLVLSSNAWLHLLRAAL